MTNPLRRCVLLIMLSLTKTQVSADARPMRIAGEVAGRIDGPAAFERMKALVGTWHATTPKGHRATSRFELMSGGSVLVERYEDDGMPAGSQMLTVWHLDGEQLVLTHYCVAGNQPHLEAALRRGRRRAAVRVRGGDEPREP